MYDLCSGLIISSKRDGKPHDNMPPFLALDYIICREDFYSLHE